MLICTSGTAAANYLPAVVEANHACVPMIVCTADRPPELRGWGAGQTIDQVGMYTTNVRWAADLPVPSDWSEPAARLAATRAFESSVGAGRGPVHLNWPLRKPSNRSMAYRFASTPHRMTGCRSPALPPPIASVNSAGTSEA